MTIKINRIPYKEVRAMNRLKSAWLHIYQNGQNSDSKDTRKAIEKFKQREDTHLKRIQSDLQKEKYIFKPAVGKLVGKKKRPIVIADVRDRVVQRAVLDVLQSQDNLKKYLEVPTSFGAIKKKGVPSAIERLMQIIQNGATHYFKSDIKAFFTKIPLPEVNSTVGKLIDDSLFVDLFERSANIEVGNLGDLGEYKQYFDFNDIGTPQGCCLSPLIGNILLYDFDSRMNQGDIYCLRYLDDFIILGPNQKAVNAAFKRAEKLLAEHGLTAYKPTENPDKSSTGKIADNIEYLGVEISNKTIRPNRESQKRIIANVKDIINESLNVDFSKVENGKKEEASLIKTLRKLSNKLKGWGNQYYFCNDKSLWGSMDSQVTDLLTSYRSNYVIRLRKLQKTESDSWRKERRLLGVHLLCDSKSEPFI